MCNVEVDDGYNENISNLFVSVDTVEQQTLEETEKLLVTKSKEICKAITEIVDHPQNRG